MADIQHATLADNLLHYPKGAGAAANNTWLRANGDGTTTFASLPSSSLTIADTITSQNTSNQLLAAQGDQLTVQFGATETSPNGSVTINANGTITFNETGVYYIDIRGAFGRTTSPGISQVLAASFINGVQSGATLPVNLDASNQGVDTNLAGGGLNEMTAGTTLDYRIYLSDDAGGSAGLIYETHAGTGFTATPSARIIIRKLGA